MRIQFWPAAIVSLLALNVTVVGITVYYAHHDKGGMVESDYYQKAVQWDQTARKQLDENRALGWKIDADPTGTNAAGLKVIDHDGKPLTGLAVEGECWHNADPTSRRTLKFEDAGQGRYRAAIDHAQAGYWHCEVVAKQGTHTATAKLDVFVTASGK